MRRIALIAALATVSAPALAQQAPQPSPQALAAVYHDQFMQSVDVVSRDAALIIDLQQEVAALQKQLAADKADTSKPKGN